MVKWRESWGKISKVICWLYSDHSDAKYGSQQQAQKSELCNRSVQRCTGGTQLTKKHCSQALDQASMFSWPIPLAFQSLIPIYGNWQYENISVFFSYAYLLCCPIHWMIRINKLPHEHPQLQLPLKKCRGWIKTYEYQEWKLKQTNISPIYLLLLAARFPRCASEPARYL